MTTRGTFGQPINNMGGCPDCDAEYRVVEIEENVRVLQILHDDTCPDYQSRGNNRSRT